MPATAAGSGSLWKGIGRIGPGLNLPKGELAMEADMWD